MSSQSSVRSAEKAAEEAAKREAREAVKKMIADQEEINDAAFTTTLDMFGVHYSSREGAISVAHTICSNFDSGMDGLTVAMSIVASGQYSPEQAGAMVGAATSIYCPEYEHLIPG